MLHLNILAVWFIIDLVYLYLYNYHCLSPCETVWFRRLFLYFYPLNLSSCRKYNQLSWLKILVAWFHLQSSNLQEKATVSLIPMLLTVQTRFYQMSISKELYYNISGFKTFIAFIIYFLNPVKRCKHYKAVNTIYYHFLITFQMNYKTNHLMVRKNIQ